MKRIFIVIVLAIATAFAASAQAPTLERNGRFLSLNGVTLSDEEIQGILSPEVFNETYVGARKQIEAGKKLLIAGVATAPIGIGLMVAGAVGMSEYASDEYSYDDPAPGSIAALYLGCLSIMASAACIDAAIPLSIIGRKRLDWVSEDFNESRQASKAYLDFGAQEHGFGLALKF